MVFERFRRYKSSFWTTLCIAFQLLPTSAHAAPGDVLFLESWSSGAGNWRTASTAGSGPGANSSSVGISSSSSAQVSGEYVSESILWHYGRVWSKPISVTPGTSYCFSAWARGSLKSAPAIGIHFAPIDGSQTHERWMFGTVGSKAQVLLPIDGKWHWNARAFVPNTGETQLYVKFENYDLEGAQGTVADFDEIAVTEGPCPASPTDVPGTHYNCEGTSPAVSSEDTCIPCNKSYGNGFGSCPSSALPYCNSDGSCGKNCRSDDQCSTTKWCNDRDPSNSPPRVCEPKKPNGDVVPGGTCDSTLGARACLAGVCSTADQKCGYPDGDPCNSTNGPTICRSGVCDSVKKVCIPQTKACAVDQDCPSTSWCQKSTLTCQPKIPNGRPLPNDPGHDPILNAKCTDPAAAATCVSSVCSTSDDNCGYKNGEGSCAASTTTDKCRSGYCASDGKCGDTPKCQKDADCNDISGWCNVGLGACQPKIPNGQPIPKDPGHDPTLDENCTVPAGKAVCASAVCSTADQKCGHPDGEGPCTASNAGTVCRSGHCTKTTLVCTSKKDGCAADKDCASSEWCNQTTSSCTPKLQDGEPLPTDAKHLNPVLNARCTESAAQTVCVSGICNPESDRCGAMPTKGLLGGGGFTCSAAHIGASGVLSFPLLLSVVALIKRRRLRDLSL